MAAGGSAGDSVAAGRPGTHHCVGHRAGGAHSVCLNFRVQNPKPIYNRGGGVGVYALSVNMWLDKHCGRDVSGMCASHKYLSMY